jgi:hypothetical protein
VYSRELEGEILRLAPSGWTYGSHPPTSVFVLADKETRSLWFPVTRDDCCALVCIAGVHADRELKGLMNMERTEWSRWLSGFPASKFVHD